MMTLPGRLSARSISVALLAVGVLIGAGLTIRGIASMWLPDLGIEVKPAGYAVLSLLLVGFVGSALGGLVVFLRGLLAVTRWAIGVQDTHPGQSNP